MSKIKQSVLDINISSYDATPAVVTPYRDILHEGSYDSMIISLEEVLTDDKVTAIDCIQRLTDDEGTVYDVRFRVFIEGLNKWATTFKQYGFNGSLRELVGLEERILIKHGKRYAYIADRKLVPTKQGTEAAPDRKKSRIAIDNRKNPPVSQREILVSDNDTEGDEDFDDFCDFLPDEE